MAVSVPFTNPIVAGITLIRTAIQSPNYVAGVSGWTINKDGSVEFNNAFIRGTLEAGGGNVRLNASGVKVDGPTKQFDINFNAGFLARRVPDDGSSAQMVVPTGTPTSTSGGELLLAVPEPSVVNANSFNSGVAYVDTLVSGAKDSPFMNIISPSVLTKADSNIVLYGQGSNSVADDSHIDLFTNEVNVNADMTITGDLVVTGVGGFQFLSVPGPVNVTNSITLVNLPGSVLTIPAGASCVVELYAAYNGPVAADARWAWAISSANISIDRNIIAVADSTTDNTDTTMEAIRRSQATQQITGTPNAVANAFTVYSEWSVAKNSGATDELIQLQFAQGTANATPSVFQTAYIRMQRVV